jgi:hypothetical protein
MAAEGAWYEVINNGRRGLIDETFIAMPWARHLPNRRGDYEATIDDTKTFTRPWKISLPLYRRLEKNAKLLEFKCVEFTEELIYGHLRKPTN